MLPRSGSLTFALGYIFASYNNDTYIVYTLALDRICHQQMYHFLHVICKCLDWSIFGILQKGMNWNVLVALILADMRGGQTLDTATI